MPGSSMRNQKKGNAMDNNIELFDQYIDDTLNADEKQAFERRLRSDKSFATDFRVYLFTLKGICQEAEQDNIEFGHAMKQISKRNFCASWAAVHDRKLFVWATCASEWHGSLQ